MRDPKSANTGLFKYLSIQNGLIIGFAAMLTLMFVITLVGVSRMQATQRQLDIIVNKHMAKVSLSTEMRSIARERTLLLYRILYLNDPFERDESEIELLNYAGRFARARLKLIAMELDDREKALLAQLSKDVGIALPALRNIVDLVNNSDFDTAHKMIVTTSIPAQNTVIRTLEKLYAHQYEEAQKAAEQAHAAFIQARQWMYFLYASLLGLGIFIAIFVLKRAKNAEYEKTKHLTMIENANDELMKYSTELIIARDAAQQASKAKSQFLANMSHELRTPMNAIMGYSQLLMEDAENSKNEELHSDLKRIYDASTHLLSLIDQVLDLSKVEAGKMEIHAEPFKVNKLIVEVLQTLEPMSRNHECKLNVEVDPGLDLMISDHTKIRQILYNLLSNAFKFTKQGKIRLAAKLVDVDSRQFLELSVKDDGIGISESQLQRIFAPFIQVDNSSTRRYDGTGLGLALTKRYVELLHGEIIVNSVVNEGSEFIIRLPLIHNYTP